VTQTSSIDIWIIPLDSPNHPLDDSRALLSEAERTQADRFKFPEIQQRYVMAHAGLRRILALYIPEKPETITYEINAFGKPALAKGTTPGDIQFNLSHSGKLALVAVVRDRLVGIDVECIKPLMDHMRITERYFSPDEMAALKLMDPSKSNEAFIQLWVGKEAFIKARGEGLSLPLSQFSLAGLIEHPGKSSCKVKLPGDQTTWSVHNIKLMTGYLGAIAVEGAIRDIQYHEE
jgi:4'-phosphopantetheinyl transferase